MKPVNTLNADHATLRRQCRKLDESAICLHDLSNLIQSAQQDAIDLCSRDYSIFHEDSCPGYELVYLLLRQGNVLRRITSDENLFRVTSLSSSRAVSVDLGEWGREIDSCIGCRLDELDILSRSSAYDCVEG
jgi:hypothetical protein